MSHRQPENDFMSETTIQFHNGPSAAARAAAGCAPSACYALYDKHGIPILPGDTVKVFHFVAAVRREKRFMYKLVMGIEVRGENKTPLMKLNHLDLTDGYYWQLMDGRTLPDYEIVQGYGGVPSGGDFRDRERKKHNKDSATPVV